MGRVALVGELAATMSHDLRQPLAAIRMNAEAGAKIVARDTGQLGDEERGICREIFSEIVADDVLASDIITRVRALVRREELPQQPVDLNEVCRTSARLLQYDALTRGMRNHLVARSRAYQRSPAIPFSFSRSC